MQDLKVAIIQTQQFWEDKVANLAHFENKYLNDLIGEDLDLVLLPEMFNTGFTMNAAEMAETMDGDSVLWLISWANKLHCQLGASVIIEENGKYYNRFVIASSNGVETFYNKRHLFRMANEQEHFTPGNDKVIHKLKGWNILLQVCYDLRFPVFSRNKTKGEELEYDLVIYVANWPEKRNIVWKTLLLARAMENQAYCIGVNRVGTDGNDISYSGDSTLIDPWGNPIFEFSENMEMVKILTLSSNTLKEIKERFPAFKDAD